MRGMSPRSPLAPLLIALALAPACGGAPSLVPLTPTQRAVVLEARSTRLDLARFGAVVPAVVVRDDRPWLALRHGEREALLAPVAPPGLDEPTCRAELPDTGGYFWFESSPPAALRLDERASLRWYDVQRDCWTFGELAPETAGPSLELARTSIVRPRGEVGSPLEPTTLSLSGPILPVGTRLEVSAAQGLALTLWGPRYSVDDDAPPVIARLGAIDLTPGPDEQERVDPHEVDSWARDLRVRAVRPRGDEPWLVTVHWQEERHSEVGQGAPWVAVEVHWTLRADERRVEPVSYRGTRRWGRHGDAGPRIHEVRRAGGDLLLARGRLRRAIRVEAPAHDRVLLADGDSRVATEAYDGALSWELVPIEGGAPLRLWPGVDLDDPPAEPACGPPPPLRQDISGDWLDRPGSGRPIWDAAPWIIQRSTLTGGAKEIEGLPGETRWSPVGCGWLLHREVALRGKRAWLDRAGDEEVVRFGEGEGAAEVDLLLDPISGATRVLRARRRASWTRLAPPSAGTVKQSPPGKAP
ncbi:MAG: hypothetical protein CSA66_01535 [Proteobacteria bacterium]|nr:MAG: hypothetical protein CSA66_01535 [Pseudomonadota bacterium]